MLYLDFNKSSTDTNKDTTATIDIQTQLPTNFSKLAVSKADLTLSLPFMTVNIQNPQTYYATGSERYGHFSQDNGYYQVKDYKIFYCDYDANAVTPAPRYVERDIYFKNEEFITNNIGEKDAGSGNKIYDNFNNYFVINHFNSFLKSLNENINLLLYDIWQDTTDADNLQSLFYTDTNNILNCYMLLNNQPGTHNHCLVDNINDAISDITGKKFCLGFSKALYDLLLSPFTYNKETYNNTDYYFVNNGLIGRGNVFNISYGGGYSYDLIELHNNYYIDYAPTFTSIVLVFNSTVSPLTVNVRRKDFIFNDDTGGDTTLSNIPIIQKFQLNRNTEQIYKLVYSNNAITNNYSSINSLNLQRLQLKLMIQDKFGYLYDMNFNNNNEYIYVQLAVFN